MDISKKKPAYIISSPLRLYLEKFDRDMKLPVSYEGLMHWKEGFPIMDKNGVDTLWESVMYEPSRMEELNQGLTEVYALLKTDGDISVIGHLRVDRIDFCHFGNSNPFRIRIINQFNDNYDYFYVKVADASRVYGLEFEHILSPNRINYLVDGNSLIEEHIAGIPGDQFIDQFLSMSNFGKVRLAKEFVKFNERCFVRLLGDMRSYNYVIDITPDFEEAQYRVRAIDFDQQCYEGRKNVYLPQFFKENNAIVDFCREIMTPETITQYKYEERILIKKRYESASYRTNDLLVAIKQDSLSTPKKKNQLKTELNKYHKTQEFNRCGTMGEIMGVHLELMLTKPIPEKISSAFNL
ncbi:hypothetical protein OAL26_00720 [Flavobacteriales bacterium]|nr:hypothetical protein [Flavobacteriales bacterium]